MDWQDVLFSFSTNHDNVSFSFSKNLYLDDDLVLSQDGDLLSEGLPDVASEKVRFSLSEIVVNLRLTVSLIHDGVKHLFSPPFTLCSIVIALFNYLTAGRRRGPAR